MRTSDSLAALAPALAAAQAEIESIGKDSVNPHFKSRYASLDNIMAEVRPVLAKHGLSILQGVVHPEVQEQGRLVGFTVETMLLHKSGEFVANVTPMPLAKNDAQGAGGALTYGRRYGVSALLALATDDDDDGNGASKAPAYRDAKPVSRPSPAPARTVANVDPQGDPPSEKQVALLERLMKSHVFSDAERKQAEIATSSKERTSKAIEWAQTQIAARKAAEQEAA